MFQKLFGAGTHRPASSKMTLEGMWNTPMPVEFIVDKENDNPEKGVRAFISKRGHLRMSVEKKEEDVDDGTGDVEKKAIRFMTLTEVQRFAKDSDGWEHSDFQVTGRANIKFDRIHWDNGCSWTRRGATAADKAMIRKESEAAARGADQEQVATAVPVIQTEAVHQAGFCGFCGAKPPEDPSDKVAAPAATGDGTVAKLPDVPQTAPRDLNDGFFDEDQLEDIIDRINDHVGLWGVSEATEREYIKPPVVMMNKMIRSAMDGFLDNPLVHLIQYMMDEAMSAMDKARKFSQYMHEKFVLPLTHQLIMKLEDQYKGVKWIEGQVEKVVKMMSRMVTDEITTKTVEQLQDSSAVS